MGSFVAWEGRTGHAASLNTATGPRIVITAYWLALFLRRLLNSPMVCARTSPPVSPSTSVD